MNLKKRLGIIMSTSVLVTSLISPAAISFASDSTNVVSQKEFYYELSDSERAELENKLAISKEKVDSLKQNLDKALLRKQQLEQKLENAEEEYQKGLVGFVDYELTKENLDEKQREDLVSAKELLNKGLTRDIETLPNVKFTKFDPKRNGKLIAMGDERDSISIVNIKKGLNVLSKISDLIEKDENFNANGTYKTPSTNFYMIALACISCNRAAATMDHAYYSEEAGAYDVSSSENLAWGYGASPEYGWYTTEKAEYDIIKNELGITDLSKEENRDKILDEAYKRKIVVGHYTAFFWDENSVAAVGYNDYSPYGNTSAYKGKDQSYWKYYDYTIEEMSSMLDEYLLTIDASNIQKEIDQSIVESNQVKAEYEAAKEEYDSIYDQLYHTHKGEFVKEYPSTCVDYGMKEHYKCKCGKLFLDIECTKEVNSKDLRLELDPDNHSFGEWIIDKEPTGTSEGHMYRVCKCGKKEEKNITKLSGKWVKYSKGWCYQYEDKSWAYGLVDIDGSTYYFDKGGYMVTGWQKINGKDYAFKPSGAMYKNEWCGNYYLGSDGVMLVNQKIPGTNYYVDANGKLVPQGWQGNSSSGYWYNKGTTYVRNKFEDIGGSTYYFDANGYMATGWKIIGKDDYAFKSSGAMYKNEWCGNYYLGSDGKMLRNTKTPSGSYVDANGKWVVQGWQGNSSSGYWYNKGTTYVRNKFEDIGGSTYYFDANGYMATGWKVIGKDDYAFKSSGAMYKNEWCGNYYLGSDGKMLRNTKTPSGSYVDVNGKWVVQGWQGNSSSGYWYNKGTTYVRNKFEDIGGSTYYFDGNGYMATGWKVINGEYYAFKSSGAMYKNEWCGNYYLGSDGKMLRNTVTPDGWKVNESGYAVEKVKK